MEDFNKQLSELKDNVIEQIKTIVIDNTDYYDKFAFSTPFWCLVASDDDSPSILSAESIRYDRKEEELRLYGEWFNGSSVEDGILIDELTVNSIVDTYNQLYGDLNTAKTNKLHHLLENHVDGIKCDGTLTIRSIAVEGIGLSLSGKVILDYTDNGESCYMTINCDKFSNDELDLLINYAEDQLGRQIDISLTPAQQTAVEKFKAALKELEELKVTIIEDHCNNLLVFANGDGIEYMDSECYDENSEGYFSVDKQVGELDGVEIADFSYFSDSALVLAKKD